MASPSSVAVALLSLLATQAFAAETNPPSVMNNPGYLADSAGNAVFSSAGDCWHTGSWTPSLANVVGCDGVMAKAMPVAVPAPQPEPPPPSAAPTPAPAPIPVKPEPVSEKVTFQADTLFDFDKSILKEEGKKTLTELANRLGSMKVEVVLAVGHTDAIGSNEYNQKLSLRRAAAVKEFLLSKSLPADKIYVQGKGESQPVASNKTKDGRAKNRRVDVEIVGVRTK